MRSTHIIALPALLFSAGCLGGDDDDYDASTDTFSYDDYE